MWQRIIETLKTLATSKKALAAAGAIATILSTQGVTADSMNQVTAIVIAYLFGQGIADHNRAK